MAVMAKRGKIVAVASAAVAVAVLIAAGLATNGWMRERWYLQKLRTEKDWRIPAERLADLRSIEAVAFFLGESARLKPQVVGLPRRTRNHTTEDGERFEGCVLALVTMAEMMGAEDFTRMLIEVLRDVKRGVCTRAAAAGCLGGEHTQRDHSIRALLEGLADSEPLVRANSAMTLGRMKPPVGEAIQPLTDLLSDGDEQVRQVAAEALKKIQGTRDESSR